MLMVLLHITSKTISKFVPTLVAPNGGGVVEIIIKKSNPASQPPVKKSPVKKQLSNFLCLSKVANSSNGI